LFNFLAIHQYTQYLVYCDIPEGFDPHYVVVIKNQTCNESHVYWLIPIDKVSPEHRKPQGEFAICVNRLYGVTQNYLLFIQFVETYRIYGVSHFYGMSLLKLNEAVWINSVGPLNAINVSNRS